MTDRTLLILLVLEMVPLGLILLVLPRISRRGLLFGVYVGEEASRGPVAARIIRRWTMGMLLTLGASVSAGLLLALGSGGPAVLASQLILFGGLLLCYLRAHFRSRSLAREGPPAVAGSLEVERPVRLVLPPLTLALTLAAGVLAAGYAWSQFDRLPESIPVHFDAAGNPDRFAPKTFGSVMLLPLMTLLFGPVMAGAAWMTARAKRAIRHPDDGRSLAAQMRFRMAVSRFLCGMSLLVSAMMTSMAIASIHVGLGRSVRMQPLIGLLGGAIALFALGGVAWLALRYGQGGSRLEGTAAAGPLTDGLADNRRWYLGVIYANPEDPSLVVEHRFGLGYTLNLGNWKAVALLGGFLLLMLAFLLALAAI